MKTYETRFVLSAKTAEDLGALGYEVKAAYTNSLGQPVIIMQREMPVHHEPEEWPPIEDQLAAISVAKVAIEKAAIQ